MVDIKEWTYLPAYTCTSQAADRDLWSVNARQPSEVMTLPDTRYQKWHLLEQMSIPLIQLQLKCESTLFNWITVKNCIHAIKLCCCDDAFWKLFTGISQFCSIFWELLQHLICCSFGLTLRQVLYKTMLTFSFHMISRILFLFENNQSTQDVVVSVLTSQNTRLSPWLTFH